MRQLFLLLLICVSFHAPAQQFTTTVSEKKDGHAGCTNCVIYVGENYIYKSEKGVRDHLRYGFGWNKTRIGYTIKMADKAGKVLKENELADGKRVYGIFVSDLRKVGNRLFLIYDEVGESNTIGNIMAVEIDTATLQTSEPKIICSVAKYPDLKLNYSESMQNRFTYQFKVSPHQKTNAIYLKWEQKEFIISVLDSNLNMLWEKKGTLEAPTLHKASQVTVDDRGQVYMPYTLEKSSVNATDQYVNRVAILVNKDKQADIGLPFDKVQPNEVLMLHARDGRWLHVAGGYNENSNEVRGAYHVTIDKENLKVASYSQTPFPVSFLQKLVNAPSSFSKKQDVFMASGYVARLLEMEDGTINMVGEFRGFEMGTRASFYEAGSLVHFYFTPNGTSFAIIPKLQVSTTSSLPRTYFATTVGKTAFIFYNDHPSNAAKDISERPVKADVVTTHVLMVGIISPDGMVKRQIVLDLRKEELIPDIEKMTSPAPGVVEVPFIRQRLFGGVASGYKIVKVEIKP